jgi:pimeloyl-ACP methyl ester carboxylesterase
MEQQVTDGIADVNGTRLRYTVMGQGTPTVFVHGIGLDRRMWTPQLARFQRAHQCVAYDMRGFGESAPESVGRRVRLS